MQAVQLVWEPTSQALLGSCAGCLSGVGTYLSGIVGQWCRLVKQCWDLPPGHCEVGLQTV